MSAGLRALAAVGLVAVLAGFPAQAGSTTGVGSSRDVHLMDAANGVTVTVRAPESFSGFSGYTYRFAVVGNSSTLEADYKLAVVVSPGSDTEARWNGSVHVPAGTANTSADVVIAPDALPFTLANTPFSVELQEASGSVIDAALFSVDLRYREPPPDGGLLALALASASVWGIVFLYALNLHLTQRKLRARVSALERAQDGTSAEVRADGTER